MKTLISSTIILLLFLLNIQAQPVTNYLYKLDNGINIKSEHCWNQVWIQQSFAPAAKEDKSPLNVNIRVLGDLISGSEFKLLNAGKEVKIQGAAPGKYDLQLTFKLSGKPGKLSFQVENIEIKAATRTNLSVTLYDYQINISEKQGAQGGLTAYETVVNKWKTYTIQDSYQALPTFYEKGKHDKAITPDQPTGKIKGKIKAATYDLLLSVAIANQTHQVWLENFQMKPDVAYTVTLNLNAGGIVYAGGNKEVKGMSLYPAGTAAKQAGKAEPVKNLEIIGYDNVSTVNCCSPGTYDVLLKFPKTSKFEWRKNIAISSGIKSEVK
jgi:hypothetical protein